MSEQTEEKAVKLSDTYSMRCGVEYTDVLRDLSKNYSNKQEFAKAIIDSLNNVNVDDTVLREKDAEIQALNERIKTLENANNLDVNKLFNGYVLVPCDIEEWECLKYLMEREREDLGTDEIYPGMVYQYMLQEYFINGNSLSLQSIPDRILRQIEKKCNDGNIG